MTAADLDPVLAVRLSTHENAITRQELEEDYGITTEGLARDMKTHIRGWLCEVDGRVAGFSMGDASNGEVQVVAVHPDFEGCGIGRRVLAAVCDWLFAEGHARIWLAANPDLDIRATGFYEKLGWRRNGAMKGEDEILVLVKPSPR
ncbi:GNAT family N-acetyltransferase [Hwanghaeella grinnelliae]|nr:GNAT family N-acetyltransferase [Hwanghaeella grinnelliae]